MSKLLKNGVEIAGNSIRPIHVIEGIYVYITFDTYMYNEYSNL